MKRRADCRVQVKYIVICGHYDCALIRESDDNEVHGWHKFAHVSI